MVGHLPPPKVSNTNVFRSTVYIIRLLSLHLKTSYSSKSELSGVSRFSEMHSLYAPVLSWHVLHFLQLNSVNITCLISRNTKTQQVYHTLLLFPKEENNTFSTISLSARAETVCLPPINCSESLQCNILLYILCKCKKRKISPQPEKAHCATIQKSRYHLVEEPSRIR